MGPRWFSTRTLYASWTGIRLRDKRLHNGSGSGIHWTKVAYAVKWTLCADYVPGMVPSLFHLETFSGGYRFRVSSASRRCSMMALTHARLPSCRRSRSTLRSSRPWRGLEQTAKATESLGEGTPMREFAIECRFRFHVNHKKESKE